MKKVLILAVALIFVFSGIALAGVQNSKHDMVTNATNLGSITDGTTSGTTDQVCVFCHHPHRTGATAAEAQVLWNRNGQGDSTGYLTYTSNLASMSTIVDGGSLGTGTGSQHTRMCLSCHDSTNAVSVVDTMPGGTTAFGTTYSLASTDQANIGGDSNTLQNDHPVDFNYSDAAVANTEFPAPANDEITGTGGNYPLYGNTMQCGTCHDPHNDATSAGIQFIRNSTGTGAPLAGSVLCSDCHVNH